MPFVLCFRYESDQDWENDLGQIYDDPQEAAGRVKTLNARYKSHGSNTRWKVKTLKPEDPLLWRRREEARLEDGTYTKPPWDSDLRYKSRWLEHVDPDDPTKVRFFASEEDAWRDKYTSMSPWKFYRRYIDDHIKPDKLDGYCAKMGLDLTVSPLQLARTSDEIEHVYTNGPHSCMAYTLDKDQFSTDIHPVRVYGNLDLACAYIARGDDITARCMVWPDKKIHGRIYGDAARIRERLAEEGYTEDWNFVGARIHRIKSGDTYVAPYLDGELEAEWGDDERYFVLSLNKFIIMKEPSGVVSTTCCQNCEVEGVNLDWNDDQELYVCEGCE